MKNYIFLVLLTIGVGLMLSTSGKTDFVSGLFDGKIKTDQTITLEAVVSTSPQDVFSMWTTAEGIQSFFAPAARIGRGPGGEYTILFSPGKDPDGRSHGTLGARILEYEPGKKLSFEWITFALDSSLGVSGPPVVSIKERNVVPLPTWVELNFIAVDGGKRTAISFRHYGFRRGGKWEESFQWFTLQWAKVLDNHKRVIEEKEIS